MPLRLRLRRRVRACKPPSRKSFSLKRNRVQPRKKAIKPQPQCVSNSEAASGLLTRLQGTDALANLPGSPYQATRTTDTHPRGWVRRAGNTPRLARRLSFHILSSPEKKEYGPRRALTILPGRNYKAEINKAAAWVRLGQSLCTLGIPPIHKSAFDAQRR